MTPLIYVNIHLYRHSVHITVHTLIEQLVLQAVFVQTGIVPK